MADTAIPQWAYELANRLHSDPRLGSRDRLAAYVEQLKEERGDG